MSGGGGKEEATLDYRPIARPCPQALLERRQGSVALAARHAGIDRVHLHRLVEKHDLER